MGTITIDVSNSFKMTGKCLLPEGWDVVTLEDVCAKAINGGTPSTEVEKYWEGEIPWITGADILNQKVSKIRRYITEEAVRNSSTNVIPKGNLLVVTRTGVGKLAIAPFDVAVSQDFTGIIPTETIKTEFLFWLLNNSANYFLDLTQGTSINGITRKDLMRFVFPRPPLPEQHRIAAILSTIDSAIEQTEAIIAKQQRIKTGLMQDLLTRGIDEHGSIRSEETHEFKDSPLGRIPVEWGVGGFENYVMSEAGIKPGPFGSSLTKDMYVEVGYRVYGQEQVIGGTLDIGDYFITGRKYSEMGGFAVEEGDVLISLVGTIGHVLIVPHRYHPGVINPRLLRFRPDPQHCVPQFLKALLLSQPVRIQLDTFATGGTMPVLSGGIIRKLGVVILGLNEQKRIIQMIAGSEAALLSSSTHLAKLRSLKTALMQDLLTGKKRVTALLIRVNDNDNGKGVD